MCLNKKFFVLFILFFFKFNFINASEKIAFLDLDYILNNSNLGKKIYIDGVIMKEKKNSRKQKIKKKPDKNKKISWKEYKNL